MEISRQIEDHSLFYSFCFCTFCNEFHTNQCRFLFLQLTSYCSSLHSAVLDIIQTGRKEGLGNNFLTNHCKFRFVTLPQEILDKMKLHPWNFRNLCYTLWKFQGLYPRLTEIPLDFFLITPVNSFYWPLEFPHFIQKFHVISHPPHPPPSAFFLKQPIHTVISPYSDEWLIFFCGNLILLQKKEMNKNEKNINI